MYGHTVVSVFRIFPRSRDITQHFFYLGQTNEIGALRNLTVISKSLYVKLYGSSPVCVRVCACVCVCVCCATPQSAPDTLSVTTLSKGLKISKTSLGVRNMASGWVREPHIHFSDSLLPLLHSSLPLYSPAWISPCASQTLPQPGPLCRLRPFMGAEAFTRSSRIMNNEPAPH